MVDAFGKDIKVGNKILSSNRSYGSTQFVIGKVLELKAHPQRNVLDRITIKPLKSTRPINVKKITIYASNAVILER